ncbi:MAG: hypothetical protein SPM31_06450 [Prevotella sp.]|jgi:hypothetical protein|uniref:hypothetical protein n=1 Tax=Prevotella lacticifex TaxID=2854755 RepID=UPI001CC4C22E|nr:hypothetical protein [Prevotella lacticifex]MDY6266751.1 hypothetical protein [Prevotella sp.]
MTDAGRTEPGALWKEIPDRRQPGEKEVWHCSSTFSTRRRTMPDIFLFTATDSDLP